MSKNPLITIITVCYNSEKTICNTIESILNQTYQNIEYILIDGNSTDNTVNCIKKYEPLFLNKNIKYKWISEKDLGIYDAMNKGIDIATGDWINFMNSDDSFYRADVLKNLFSNINYKNIYVLYGSINNIEENLEYIKPPESVKNIWKHMVFCHQSSFVKSDLLKKYRFNTKYKICADFDLYFKLYNNSFKFYNTKHIIANYNSRGYSSKNATRMYKEKMKIVLSYKKYNNYIIYCYHKFQIYSFKFKSYLKKFLPIDLYIKIKRYINK